MGKTVAVIIESINKMSSDEAKDKLAELMINHYRIGHGGYTEEQCMNDYKNIFKEIVFQKK